MSIKMAICARTGKFTVYLVMWSFCLVFVDSADQNALSNSEIGKRLKVSRDDHKELGLNYEMKIPMPEFYPDPYYTVSQNLDYWPYKKHYTFHLSTILKKVYKVLWYFYEMACLVFRILFQVFDIFQMKKSYEALSKHGWKSEGGENDWRKLGRLLTNPNAYLS